MRGSGRVSRCACFTRFNMRHIIGLTIFASVLCASQAHGELIDGKVESLKPKNRQTGSSSRPTAHAPDDADTLAHLSEQLESEGDEIAWKVITAFAMAGPHAVPTLKKALKDEKPIVRARAAASLGQMARYMRLRGVAYPHDAVQALVEGLTDNDERVIVSVTQSLGHVAQTQSGELTKAASGLVSNLKHADAKVRYWSAHELKFFGPTGRDAIPALRQASMEDKDEVVRSSAKWTIDELLYEYRPTRWPPHRRTVLPQPGPRTPLDP